MVSSDGRFVVTLATDLTEVCSRYRVWNAETARLLFTINARQELHPKAAFSPDGSRLFVKTLDGVECWDIGTLSRRWSHSSFWDFVVHNDTVYGHTYDSSLKLYSVATIAVESGKLFQTAKFKSSPVGLLFDDVNGSRYIKIRSWQASDTVVVLDWRWQKTKDKFAIPRDSEIELSPDNRYLLIHSNETVKCVSTADFDPVFSFDQKPSEEIVSAKFLRANGLLLVHTHNKYTDENISCDGFSLIDITTKSYIVENKPMIHAVQTVLLRNDSALAIVTTDSLIVYHLQSERKKSCSLRDSRNKSVTAFAELSDSFLVGFDDGFLYKYPLQDLKNPIFFVGFPSPIVKARFTDNSNFITWNDHYWKTEGGMEDWMERMGIYSYWDILKRWSVEDGSQDTTAFNGGKCIGRIAVSMDGSYGMQYSGANEITVWDSRRRKKVVTFDKDTTQDYFRLSFSSDNKKIVYTTLAKERSQHQYVLEARSIKTGKILKSFLLSDSETVVGVSQTNDYLMMKTARGYELRDLNTNRVLALMKDLVIPEVHFTRDEDREFFFLNNGKVSFLAFEDGRLTEYQINSSQVEKIKALDVKYNSESELGYLHGNTGRYVLFHCEKGLKIWKTGVQSEPLVDSMHFPISKSLMIQFDRKDNFVVVAGIRNDSLLYCKWNFKDKHRRIEKFPLNIGDIGHDYLLNSTSISTDGRLALFTTTNSTVIVFSISQGRILYQLIPILFQDHFVFDDSGRFDGTSLGIDLAYYRCGTRVVFFSSLTDAPYEKGLVKKIMNGNHAAIKAKTIFELGICDKK